MKKIVYRDGEEALARRIKEINDALTPAQRAERDYQNALAEARSQWRQLQEGETYDELYERVYKNGGVVEKGLIEWCKQSGYWNETYWQMHLRMEKDAMDKQRAEIIAEGGEPCEIPPHFWEDGGWKDRP